MTIAGCLNGAYKFVMVAYHATRTRTPIITSGLAVSNAGGRPARPEEHRGCCSLLSFRCAAFVPMQMRHSHWVSGPVGEVDKLSSKLSSQTPQVQRLWRPWTA